MEISNVSKISADFGSQVSTAAPKAVEAPSAAKIVEISSAKADKQTNEAPAAEISPEKGASMSTLKAAVEKINSATDHCEAVFGIHEGTNRVTIKMVDKATKEIIKEFPADETLDLIAKAWELAGIMVDEKR